MNKSLKLTSGVTGFYDANNNFVATGSQMGRYSILPPAALRPKFRSKLCLRRLKFVDEAYDKKGAYWGAPANVWCAWGYDAHGMEDDVEYFFRADSREEAKQKVREVLPNARFYR